MSAQKDPSTLATENAQLRRMLCVSYSGSHAYMDDGEAQDCRVHPFIDFMRDTPDEIQEKMRARWLNSGESPAA